MRKPKLVEIDDDTLISGLVNKPAMEGPCIERLLMNIVSAYRAAQILLVSKSPSVEIFRYNTSQGFSYVKLSMF